MGKRTQYRNNRLYIEQDDAKELLEGQKLTIYKWGNSLVTKIEKENDKIIRVHANLKGTKVAHWVLKKEEFVIKNLIIKLN